jgi:PAS domain S-box-containing protein
MQDGQNPADIAYQENGVSYADAPFSHVTERARADEALRQERDFISAVLDTAGALVAVLDREGRILRFNRACERTTGYSFDEVRGKLLWDLFLIPEEVELVKAVFEELQAGQFPNEYENYWVTKHGDRRLIAWSNTALPGADGTVAYVIGTGIDVTERRQAESQRDATLKALQTAHQDLELRVVERTAELREANESLQEEIAERRWAEEALRQSEGHMRSLMESARSYAVYRIAVDLTNPFLARVVLVSPSMKELLSIPDLQDFATWFDRIHSDDMARIVEANRCSLETGVPFDQQFRVFSEGRGEWAWVHVRSTPVFDDGGRLTHFNGLVADVTEQKRAQEALQEAYQTLEQRVEDRTRELAALNVISGVVSRSLDLNKIMSSALEKTMEVTQMEMGAVYRALVDGDSDEPSLKPVAYKLVAYRGLSEELVRAVDRIPLRNSAMEQAAALGRPYVWHVADVPPHAGLAKLFEKEGLHFAISIPLTAKGQIVGGMNIGTRQAKAVTSETLSLLAAIGQQIGMAVENARLYEAEQDRREESEGRRRVAEGMREILAMLNSRQSLPEILDFIASQTCRLLRSEAAAILRLEDNVLRIQAACGLEPDYVAGVTLRPGEGGAGRAVAARQPVIMSDLAEAALLTPEHEIPPEPQKSLIERLFREYRAILSVPLIVQGRDYGAITVYYARPRDFSEEDLSLAMGVADQVALAIENARLREQAGQSAALEERGRLARELHDSVTQSLYGVTMYAEAAARLMTSDQGTAAAEYLRDARDTAQEALREMRLLIYQLRPPLLEKGGLAVALQVRLDAVERRGGIQAELHIEGQERLPPTIQAELHQVAQEALNNALKHAHARKVQVQLHFGEAATCLEVQDDGVGFDLTAARDGGGLGIPGMKERVQKIGGRLEIKSAPGQGTKIVVEVPTGGEE